MDEQNQARLLTAMITCLDITEDQYKIMNTELSSLSKKAISNLKHFSILFAQKKSPNRRQTKINKDDFKTFKNSTSSIKYKTLRSTCALEPIIEKCSSNNLEFPWVIQPITFPTVKKANKLLQKKNLFGMGDDDEDFSGEGESQPSIFVFIIGGISFSEVVAIERLQTRLNHQLYIGSTSNLTASLFLNNLAEIKNSGDIMFGNTNDEKVNLKDIDVELIEQRMSHRMNN